MNNKYSNSRITAIYFGRPFMVLHDAYAALRRLGLVANHAAFSTGYLNKGARYYDHLICSRKAPAVAALLSLFVRVKAVAEALAANLSLRN